MSWSETMFTIQHFYNAFDIDKRIKNVEYKAPLVARSINGVPENIEIASLTPGTLWFIIDDNEPSIIKSLSILTEEHIFAEPISFGNDLKDIALDDNIKTILSNMNLTAENYYDIIELILEILTTVPVERGGTGKTSISENKILIGNINNTFKEIGFDNIPIQNSENLINSGTLFELLKNIKSNFNVQSNDTGYTLVIS